MCPLGAHGLAVCDGTCRYMHRMTAWLCCHAQACSAVHAAPSTCVEKCPINSPILEPLQVQSPELLVPTAGPPQRAGMLLLMHLVVSCCLLLVAIFICGLVQTTTARSAGKGGGGFLHTVGRCIYTTGRCAPPTRILHSILQLLLPLLAIAPRALGLG